MGNCGDLALISMLDPDTQQVAAFEELIGSHGGLGGPQTEPILLFPADWELDAEIVGADAVYAQLRSWMKTATPENAMVDPDDLVEAWPREHRRVIKAEVTFLGHSTVCSRWATPAILTDPVLMDRISILERRASPLPSDLYRDIDAGGHQPPAPGPPRSARRCALWAPTRRWSSRAARGSYMRRVGFPACRGARTGQIDRH